MMVAAYEGRRSGCFGLLIAPETGCWSDVVAGKLYYLFSCFGGTLDGCTLTFSLVSTTDVRAGVSEKAKVMQVQSTRLSTVF